MTINEQDIQLTSREKFSDFLNSSPLSLIVIIPVVIILLILLPFFLLFGLTYENVIEKYYYKWTGKQRKHITPKLENPFADLSTSIDFKHVSLIDNCVENLKEKYNLTDNDFRDLEIGKIETEPQINDLSDKFFDYKTMVYQDKLFVQEIKLPYFNTSIGYIDCKNLSYQTIKNLDSYSMTLFNKTADELEITLRQKGTKTLIKVK
jgi:hypothetical protein